MLFDFLQFICQYILAGFLLGYVHVKLIERESKFANAVAFVK